MWCENARNRQGMKAAYVFQFLSLTIALSIGLGAVLASAFRADIGRNWDSKRCDPGVVATAGFFKPSTDTRTAAQFARDNWSFCQKEYVQTAIRQAAAVPKELADAEGAVVGIMREISSIVADVFFDLWNFCYEAYSAFMDRMKGVAKLFHNFMIQLHSIVGRLQAAALSIVFGLISMIAAYISATQLVLIVAIIIIGILIALQIILFFLLLPISGLIITITAIISVVVVAIATAIAAAMVAELFTPGACFAAGTRVLTSSGLAAPIETIRVGDRLRDGSTVTATHRFRLKERFWIIDGISVTGDHLVQDPERPDRRIRVRDHPDATLVLDSGEAPEVDLWCLTTTHRRIPVQGLSQAHVFADWEELDDSDEEGKRAWYAAVWRSLNPGLAPAAHPVKRALDSEAGVSPDCQIPVASWWGRRQLRRAVDVKLGDLVYTRAGVLTRVIGRVELAGDQSTDAVELPDPVHGPQLVSIGSWVRGANELLWRQPVAQRARDLHPARWIHFYTAAGEFQVGSGAWVLRDASDVGLANLSDLVDEVVLGSTSAETKNQYAI